MSALTKYRSGSGAVSTSTGTGHEPPCLITIPPQENVLWLAPKPSSPGSRRPRREATRRWRPPTRQERLRRSATTRRKARCLSFVLLLVSHTSPPILRFQPRKEGCAHLAHRLFLHLDHGGLVYAVPLASHLYIGDE